MIHIKTTRQDEQTITIKVEGRIDAQGLLPLKKVYEKSVTEKKPNIILQLDGLTGIDTEGTRFLKEIYRKITIVEAPEFLRIQLAGSISAT
ncbi:MAG TPA: hypothetical protein QF924_14380 [Pseudomonadales bacterium]|nr:hypothetical protein [Pseudomonadales bacterium]